MHNARWAAAVLLVGVAAGCTSSGKPSAAPVSSSAVTTPSVASSSQAPSPTATKALSRFEADPAVLALRAWAAQVARAINTGKTDDAALRALMTASLANSMQVLAGGEIGHRYPGPLPFTPISVTVSSSTARDVRICDVAAGYSVNSKTGKPVEKYRKQAIDAGAVLSGGRWLVSKFQLASFPCATVKIPEPSW